MSGRRAGIGPVGWAVLLGIVLALCGTALGCVALATKQATFEQLQKPAGSLVGAIIVLVVAVVWLLSMFSDG